MMSLLACLSRYGRVPVSTREVEKIDIHALGYNWTSMLKNNPSCTASWSYICMHHL